MYQFISARKDESTGTIYHRIQSELGNIEISYRDVRAGLSWPVGSTPGYFCILGCSNEKNSAGEYPLSVLFEGESNDLNTLFKSLTAAASRMECTKTVTDRSDRFLLYCKEFDRFCKQHNVSHRVIDSPCGPPENFEFGRYRIKEKIDKNALEFRADCKILREQLGRISKQDLNTEGIEKHYYAINSLRIVLDDFTNNNSSTSKTDWAALKAKHSRFG